VLTDDFSNSSHSECQGPLAAALGKQDEVRFGSMVLKRLVISAERYVNDAARS
jgi:hypothetical protein